MNTRSTRNNLEILMFHAFGDASKEMLNVSAERFRSVLIERLEQRRPISLATFAWWRREGGPLDQDYFAVTIDDGYESAFTVALPILLELQVPATFYVVPGWIGKPPYMNWRQVRAISYTEQPALTVGCHGLDHTELRAGVSLDEQIGCALAELRINGLCARHFAYPRGVYTAQAVQYLRDRDIDTAVTTRRGVNDLADDPLLLRRRPIMEHRK